MPKVHTIIIGGGLAGLSAAYFLGHESLILEKESKPGGLACSTLQDGFVFDFGGHALHSKKKNWYALLEQLGLKLFIQERKAFVDTPSGPIPFPFQYHLYRLSSPVYHECMEGLLNPPSTSDDQFPKDMNYLEWLYAAFGPGICRHFMVPYNRKIWKTDLSLLTNEFAGQRIPAFERKRLIEINQQLQPVDSQTVAYPFSGGIQAIPDAFHARIHPVHCNAVVTAVNLSAHTITVNKRESYQYKHLISTIPLPRFLECVEDLPSSLRQQIPLFAWLSMLVVNFGVRVDRLTEKQRLYVADPSILFHKVVFNMNSAPNCAPSGHSSVSVEITHRKTEHPDPGEVLKRVYGQLIQLGILKPSDPVVYEQVLQAEFGYVLYDLKRSSLTEQCRRYLEPMNVYLCGRFGEWAYLNMDAVIEHAKQIVGRILEDA